MVASASYRPGHTLLVPLDSKQTYAVGFVTPVSELLPLRPQEAE